jgi:hypothetical protein
MMAKNIVKIIFNIAVLKMWGYLQGIVWESNLLGIERRYLLMCRYMTKYFLIKEE